MRDLPAHSTAEERCFLALQASATLAVRQVEEALSPLRLTVSEYALLRIIENHPGCVAADVRVRLQTTAPAVTQLIQKLERKAYVRRGNDALDGRRQPLHLTVEGVRCLRTARRAVQRSVGAFVQTHTALDRLTHDLHELHDALRHAAA